MRKSQSLSSLLAYLKLPNSDPHTKTLVLALDYGPVLDRFEEFCSKIDPDASEEQVYCLFEQLLVSYLIGGGDSAYGELVDLTADTVAYGDCPVSRSDNMARMDDLAQRIMASIEQCTYHHLPTYDKHGFNVIRHVDYLTIRNKKAYVAILLPTAEPEVPCDRASHLQRRDIFT